MNCEPAAAPTVSTVMKNAIASAMKNSAPPMMFSAGQLKSPKPKTTVRPTNPSSAEIRPGTIGAVIAVT